MRYIYPTEDEKSRALYIVSQLFDNDFYSALCYYPDPSIHKDYYRLGFCNWLDSHQDLLSTLSIAIYTGETKACIVDDYNSHWVLKISFDRTTEPDYVSRGIDWDFCAREVEFYSKACDNNLQDCFAATYQLGKIHNVCISIQEAVEVNEDLFGDLFENYVSTWYNVNDFDSEEDYYSAVSESADDMDNEDRVYAVLGDESDNLIEFIDEHDINDLHSGNWGVASDGSYVIMDFSGYTL